MNSLEVSSPEAQTAADVLTPVGDEDGLAVAGIQWIPRASLERSVLWEIARARDEQDLLGRKHRRRHIQRVYRHQHSVVMALGPLHKALENPKAK